MPWLVWSFKMTVIFAEIVSLILRSPVPVGSGTDLYSTMETSIALDSAPAEAAPLMTHLMKHAPPNSTRPSVPPLNKATRPEGSSLEETSQITGELRFDQVSYPYRF
jgi:hypothetical protein